MKAQFPQLEEDQILYQWSEASIEVRHRLDFVARAAEFVQHEPVPAILFVHGKQDDVYPLSDVEKLYTTLIPQYEATNQRERLALQSFEHLRHQLDLEAAQGSFEVQQDLTELQQVVSNWFSQHLAKVG